MKSVLKALLWVIEGIYSLFLKIPLKVGKINLRFATCAVLAFLGFYFTFIRTDYAPTKAGFTSDVIVGLLLFGIVIDVFAHGFAEQKEIEAEDKVKVQSLN